MITLISPAKNMRPAPDVAPPLTQPRFPAQTEQIVECMVQYSAMELTEIFKVSNAIATQLKGRFLEFVNSPHTLYPAVESYDGVVYKHFKGQFSACEQEYLQSHLRISSLMYGLLRPFDAIKPYRMEGFVRLAGYDIRVDNFWRTHQTQLLIDETLSSDGTLIYLASREEQKSFDWRRVKRELRVIDIVFAQRRGDKLRQVVIYTKMARGEMLRYMIDNSIDNPDQLKDFEWEGYRYIDSLSSQNEWVWVMD